MLVYFEMGKFHVQIQWLFRTVRYWNKLVTDQCRMQRALTLRPLKILSYPRMHRKFCLRYPPGEHSFVHPCPGLFTGECVNW
jgi:hypothetical protein